VLAKAAENVLRRDRVIVAAGLVAIIALAWVYVLHLAASMSSAGVGSNGGMDAGTSEMTMPNLQAWQTGNLVLTFAMWAIMMVAMMTPSATPMILTFARINRERNADRLPFPGTIVFLSGYLMVWISFSALATLLQLGLQSAALLSPEMLNVSPVLGGVFLVLAGVYQFTPLKRACLSRCRTPLGFLMTEWREGTKGTFVMGLRHGIYCVGCCWLLMTLLFVAGVMNLVWVALIAVCVLAEKLLPAGQWTSRAIGLLTIGWGASMLIRALGA
jgi:predicted metal-binding membrane protein